MKAVWICRMLVLAALVVGSAPAEALWNIEKAREVGESVVSGPTARTFANNAQKAKEVMARLGDALAQNRVLPNGSYPGRVRAGLTTGELTTGNCQWCAEMLREALLSAGVPPQDMFLVFGHVRTGTVMGLNPFEVNKTHCALAVMVNGRPVVFDLWKHGMEKRTFSGSRSSQWNGVSFPQWAVRLRNYEWFGFENPSCASNTNKRVADCQADLVEAWRLLGRPKRTAPGAKQSSEATRFGLKTGSYQVEAGGALLTWVLSVGAGGGITGTCNGTESLSGSISGTVVKIRRACPGYDPPYQDYVGTVLGDKVVGKFRGAGVESGQSYDWSMPLRR